jgi:carboxymethylenebutenolidase
MSSKLSGMTASRTSVLIPVPDGTTLTAYLARPADDPAPIAVIVAHELFAVNPDIRGVVDDLAEAGYLAIAPEFYHRHAKPGRWLARDDAGREEGFALLHQLEREQAIMDVDACLSWLRSQPMIEQTAMIGFSTGGHLSYLAACTLPIQRTAVLYGGWLPSTDIPMSRPVPTLDLTPGITGQVLYLVGENDTLIDSEQRHQIGSALRRAHIRHELVSYPGVGHAYFWAGTPAFDAAARADSWARVLSLLAG